MATGNRKLHGNLNNAATLKVLACLFEHHLDFEFVPVNLNAGEHLKEPFLSKNPWGTVPVLEDGDILLIESRAMIRYMAHVYANNITSEGGEDLIYWSCKQQGIIADWIDVEDHHFEPPALALISELITKPDNETFIAGKGAEARLGNVLDVYEARLAKDNYLAGQKYTIADLLHLPNLDALQRIGKAKNLIDSRPLVSAWSARILARPAWTKVLEMHRTGNII